MTWLAETAMLSHGWRRFALLMLAGAIAGLSVPPLFVLPALFIAFLIWVWCLDGAEKARGWRRLVGPAFGIGIRQRLAVIAAGDAGADPRHVHE